jgi:hypothetical protein
MGDWRERRVNRHVGLYRLLHRLYPRGFREAFGDELELLFSDLLKDARQRQFGLTRLWLDVIVDLIGSSAHERMEEAMRSHPAVTRMVLVAVPLATIALTFAIGGAFGIAAAALGLVAILLVWRSFGDAIGGQSRRWWPMPALGIVLVTAGFGALAMPWSSDVRWPLANLLGLSGMLLTIGSLVRTAFLLLGRRGQPAH